MAEKKVEATTGEIIEVKELTDITEKANRVYIVHCKPVYNYQSVEFDVAISEDTKEYDLGYMEGLYRRMIEMLVRVSQNAPQKESKPSAPVEEPASEKQKEILRNFHIDFKPDITKKQAHALIKKSMDQEIF